MDSEECRRRILSQDYKDFIIPARQRKRDIGVPREELCIQYMDFGFETAYIGGETGGGRLTLESFWYNSIPNCYTLLDMSALSAAGITAVQNYASLELMGENVMIGFVDTGIDYTNMVFRNLDGSTRIAGIWDQTVQTGTPPEGLMYGSVYSREQIDEALGSDDPESIVPTRDENGHGTFLASVAAGSANVEHRFIGAAPEAAIAVVKLKEAKDYLKDFYGIYGEGPCYQENDIMLGLRYLNWLAYKENMPLMMCIALGTNFGGHNATTLMSDILRLYSTTLDRSVVIGTGNEASQRHHYYGQMTSMNDSKEVEIRVGEGVQGFAMELWTTLPNLLTIYLVSPSGERTSRISARQGDRHEYDFIFDRTTIIVEYRILMEDSDSQLIFFRFREPSLGIWKVVVEPVQVSGGQFHIWLPVKEFLQGEVYFLEANPDTTLTEPSTTVGPITVGYYDSRDNSVDINSGRGYTRNGFIKPDFAAPGVEVTGAGLGGRFVEKSGSSVAVGITGGAMALLIEWFMKQSRYGGISESQLRNLLILGANQKPSQSYPNKEWGYGTLDVFQALDKLSQV